MESAGIYWKPVFKILVGTGLTILIVNDRHIKYVKITKPIKKIVSGYPDYTFSRIIERQFCATGRDTTVSLYDTL